MSKLFTQPLYFWAINVWICNYSYMKCYYVFHPWHNFKDNLATSLLKIEWWWVIACRKTMRDINYSCPVAWRLCSLMYMDYSPCKINIDIDHSVLIAFVKIFSSYHKLVIFIHVQLFIVGSNTLKTKLIGRHFAENICKIILFNRVSFNFYDPFYYVFPGQLTICHHWVGYWLGALFIAKPFSEHSMNTETDGRTDEVKTIYLAHPHPTPLTHPPTTLYGGLTTELKLKQSEAQTHVYIQVPLNIIRLVDEGRYTFNYFTDL